ncbi:hypothetical protein [Methylomarinovum tepidoasis]|nr:hypothetical protein [Methylomarinovum sp. IN45]
MPENAPCPPLGSWPEEKPVPLDHPELPGPVREAVQALWQPGDSLHRVPCRRVVEWWLLDVDGNLVEAFWLEDR